MGNGNLLFEVLFKRKLSGADTRQYLSEIASAHPYFSPAWFFLLLLTDKNAAEYPQLAAKAAVLFNNPYWLQFQLQEKEQTYDGAAYPAGAAAGSDQMATAMEKRIAADDGYQGSGNAVDGREDGIVAKTQKESIAGENSAALAPPEETVIAESETMPLNETGFNAKQPEPIIATNLLSGDHSAIDESAASSAGTIAGAPPQEDSFDAAGEAAAILYNAGDTAETIAGSDTAPAVPKKEDPATLEKNEFPTVDIPPSFHFNDNPAPFIKQPETEAEAEGPEEEKEIAPLHFKLHIDTPPAAQDGLAFEPLHTSDYFASQGIKLSTEIKPADKLGKQLKSFTEWLKTMKKLHSDQLPQLSGQADTSIQQLAEQSNKDETVVTEAMAEVLLLQGKADKAAEVYKKLSLLNPSKSAYFAAKIDQLKEQ